ncbi:translation initiation factor 1A [Schistosoma bovis]|nr:translation initiation factor 1A [Schistosoma bovis]
MIGEIPDTIKLEENDDIEFDANAAIFEDDEDDEKGSDSEDEEGSDDDDDNSDDSDEIAEINQRYRADTGIAKDQRNNRRR